MERLHQRRIFIGDPTPSNVLFQKNGATMWIDFDMIHDSADPSICRKRDLTFFSYYAERQLPPHGGAYAKRRVLEKLAMV